VDWNGQGIPGPAGPVVYRAGNATISTGNTAVSVVFSSPLPDANYRVTLTSSSSLPWAADDICRYYNVSSKTTTGFAIDIRRCHGDRRLPARHQGEGIYAYVTLVSGEPPSVELHKVIVVWGAQGDWADSNADLRIPSRPAENVLRQNRAPHPAEDCRR